MAYSISASIELRVPSTICRMMGSMSRAPSRGAVGHGQICDCTFLDTLSSASLVGNVLHDQNTALVDLEPLARKNNRRRTEFLDHGGPVKPKAGRQGRSIIDRCVAEGAAEIDRPIAAPRLCACREAELGDGWTIDHAEA